MGQRQRYGYAFVEKRIDYGLLARAIDSRPSTS